MALGGSGSGGSTRTLSYGYTDLGNLTESTSSLAGDTDVTGYVYGAGTAGPHAVTSASIKGVLNTLTYDPNGAITRYDIAGTANDRYLAYDADNQPTTIVVGNGLEDATPVASYHNEVSANLSTDSAPQHMLGLDGTRVSVDLNADIRMLASGRMSEAEYSERGRERGKQALYGAAGLGVEMAIARVAAGIVTRILARHTLEASTAVRGLRAADFGANAAFKTLAGTIRFEGKIATVTVRNMEGNLGNAWDVLNALKGTARAGGATSLRIEATLANPDLLRAMERIFGPATRGAPGGAQDIWVLGL